MEFALAFDPLSAEPAEPAMLHAVPLGDGVYQAHARVVHRTDDLCVLDLGVLALHTWLHPEEAPAGWIQEGAYLRGDVVVSVEPGSYADWHAEDPAMPALIYRWQIERMVAEHAPRVPASEEDRARSGSPALMTNDPVRRTLTAVSEARPDEHRIGDEMLHYYLIAERLPGGPKKPVRRAASRAIAGATEESETG